MTFTPADGVDPEDYTPAEWLGEPVEIHFVRSASVLRRTRGIVCAVHVVPAERGTRARYRVRVVPPLWAAAQIRRSRIFQDCTVPQIVAQVARSSSLELSARLRGSYPQREYTVQYEETDLAFICRLMEEDSPAADRPATLSHAR